MTNPKSLPDAVERVDTAELRALLEKATPLLTCGLSNHPLPGRTERVVGFVIKEAVGGLSAMNAVQDILDAFPALLSQLDKLETENARLSGLLNTPQLHDFAEAVTREAAHQRERWAANHDAGKAPEDWFWLLGYLGGKALRAVNAGDIPKALHHTISTAAAMANWHAALNGSSTTMRPGIDAKEHGYV